MVFINKLCVGVKQYSNAAILKLLHTHLKPDRVYGYTARVLISAVQDLEMFKIYLKIFLFYKLSSSILSKFGQSTEGKK